MKELFDKIDEEWRKQLAFNRFEVVLLVAIYLVGLFLRLAPRLAIDPHLLTFQGDIWYRLAMAQYILDHRALPHPDLRYLAYGYVPMWYPPISPIFFAALSWISGLDIPTVSSRLVPFIEALTPLPLYLLGRYLYDKRVALVATMTLALTPSFVFWSGISDPQSFTLFVIPLFILTWMIHSRSEPSNLRLFVIGALLGINFLTHLSYFLVVLILLMVTIALILEKEAGKGLLIDLAKVVAISQVLTAPWWLPKNLYWWWIKALVTSSGLYPVKEQLASYGTTAAILGFVSMAYVAIKREKYYLLLLLWALPLFIETQNEVILFRLNKIAYAWYTLAKPLEGFRFYCFLAQPLSLAIGVLTLKIVDKTGDIYNRGAGGEIASMVWVGLLIVGLFTGISQYGLDTKFQTSGMTVDEYNAALWFRENSGPEDRIIADYYRSQMFAGVTGGKALIGGVFPLRNVDYPYIRAPGSVQNDLFVLYNTSSARVAYDIAKRYNSTHIFYSDNMINYGNLLSYYKSASDYGVDTDKDKFEDRRYFEIVYKRPSLYGEIVIVRIK